MPTRAPRAAHLVFDEPAVEHSPAVVELGSKDGYLQLRFRNAGDGLAQATSLFVQLPPGLHYTQTYASLPAMACSMAGETPDGELLACTGAGLPEGFSGFISFGVRADETTEWPGPVVLLGAIDASSPPSDAALDVCAIDPQPGHCAWHEIPTFAPCALQYGADGVYCDGFEIRP
jgi:hypothetical protein